MNDKFFLDTNVFIYAFDRESPRKRDRASALVVEALTGARGVTSTQAVQEFLNAAVRKFAKPLSVPDAQRYLTVVLEPLCAVFPSVELFHQALDISGRWAYSFYDSLIIAAALQADCTVLYSEDLQHGQKFGRMRIVNPFLESA